MPPVPLTDEQNAIRLELQAGVDRLRAMFRGDESDDEAAQLVQTLGEKGHQLHESLRAAGFEPRHHRYLVENRGLPPDHPDFYKHFHPLEDLLAFLADTDANNDPEDVTIGETFELKVFSTRWGHHDTYRLTRTDEGWEVRFHSIGGRCNKRGEPYLFENLEHDLIEYPHDLGGWLEWLWMQAHDRGLGTAQVQQALTELTDWVEAVEKAAPREGTWKGYK